MYRAREESPDDDAIVTHPGHVSRFGPRVEASLGSAITQQAAG